MTKEAPFSINSCQQDPSRAIKHNCPVAACIQEILKMVIATTRMAKLSPPARPSLTLFPEAFAPVCQAHNARQGDLV